MKTEYIIRKWRGDGQHIADIKKPHYRDYPKSRRRAFTFKEVFVRYITKEEYEDDTRKRTK